jgi:acyl carrier protein
VEHSSLVNLCHWHHWRCAVTSRDRASKYAGVGFDASVWEIFPYLIFGAAINIIHDAIKLDIYQLNEYFENQQITIAFLPTPIAEQFMTIENPTLRVLLTGGDKLNSYINRQYQLVNNYGPTEYTIVTTSFTVRKSDRDIPIGQPISNTRIYVLDKYNQLQPIGAAGELHISGHGLARGYSNRPALTREKFIENPFAPGAFSNQADEINAYRQMYKTGDLARWSPKGNLEFLGRIDQQVKIRGYRVELAEIENQLLKLAPIKEVVVQAKPDEQENKYLAAYLVSDPGQELTVKELREYLSQRLPQYMIPGYMVYLDKMPLTQSGKIDRNALPEPIKTGTRAGDTPPGDPLETKLVEIWSRVLLIDKESIGIDDHFFELGGDSLKAAVVMAKIRRCFQIKAVLADMFKMPIIRKMAEYIRQAEQIHLPFPEPAPKREYYPLSSVQERLYTLQQMDKTGIAYNIPTAIELEGNLDKNQLAIVFRQLIRRHESLRTSILVIEGKPVQRIHHEVEFKIEYIGLEPRAKGLERTFSGVEQGDKRA